MYGHACVCPLPLTRESKWSRNKNPKGAPKRPEVRGPFESNKRETLLAPHSVCERAHTSRSARISRPWIKISRDRLKTRREHGHDGKGKQGREVTTVTNNLSQSLDNIRGKNTSHWKSTGQFWTLNKLASKHYSLVKTDSRGIFSYRKIAEFQNRSMYYQIFSFYI